ncbi:MAG: C39 family peptidase [Methanoregula sp.]
MKRPGPAVVVILLIVMAFVLLGIAQYMIGTPPRSGSGNVSYTLDNTLPEPRYYTGIVFDTLKSNDHLTLIPLKSFRQQVTNYTCGPVAAMTVLSYYGMPANNTDADEIRIAQEMGTSANGTNPEQIASWFNRNGWNATWGTGGTGQMLRDNLEAGIPTMVEWIDWGGHWVVVVGYDTRGTETVWDDVIICADSVDSHDDRVDGITYANYGEFDAMWFDAHYFPANMSNRAYVIAVPA